MFATDAEDADAEDAEDADAEEEEEEEEDAEEPDAVLGKEPVPDMLVAILSLLFAFAFVF